uniref:Phosphatidic acid phosphatase type 2/haloperoxidase domain-containing protein n=1 Tax=Arcella intermedia TaxID=1963864 RepID=A0A6B2L6R0_9EUKA
MITGNRATLMDESELLVHETANKLPPICSITGKNYKFDVPQDDFLWVFPERLESVLNRIDGPLIRLLQSRRSKFQFYLSHVLTAIVAIEFLIIMPTVLFILGYDNLGTKTLYLSMTLVFLSQIPKRFVWRYRPFMGARAIEIQSCRTSSFPSRAVTCSVVYSYVIVFFYEEFQGEYPLWLVSPFLVLPVVVSISRIYLGVHYPSDCLGGMILGYVVCSISMFIYRADQAGCECAQTAGFCYYSNATMDILQPITLQTLTHINWWVLGGVVFGQFVFAVLCVIRPIKFWIKFGTIFGILFPALTFRFVFLCPTGSHPASISANLLPPSGWSFIFSIGLVLAGLFVGTKLQKKLLFWVFVILWVICMSALVVWRLEVTPLLHRPF